MDLSYKKRYRVAASCLVCRKRKSKCDRVKPVCGSCKKKSIAHLCYYEDGKEGGQGYQLGEHILPVPGQEHLHMNDQYQSHHRHEIHQQTLPPPQVPLLRDYTLPAPIHMKSHQQPQHQQPQHQQPQHQQPQHQQPQHQQPQHPQSQHHHQPHQNQHSPHHPQQLPLQSPSHQQVSGQQLYHSRHPSVHTSPPGHVHHSQNQHPQHHNHHNQIPSPHPIPIQQKFSHLPRQSVSSLVSEGNTPPYRSVPLESPPESIVSNANSASSLHSNSVNSAATNFSSTNMSSANSTSSVIGKYELGSIPVNSINNNIGTVFPVSGANVANVINATLIAAIDKTTKESSHVDVHTTTKPELSPNTELVLVSIGPNANLLVNPNDTINLFANASFSLNLEGPFWQQQGTLSYMGLTKSDPFIKVLRSYAILLFKLGEMASYIRNETMKRKKQVGRSETYTGSSPSVSSTGTPIYKRHKYMSPPKSTPSDLGDTESRKDVDDEPGDVVDEDALIVDKIKVTTNEEESGDEEDKDEVMESPARQDASTQDSPASTTSTNSKKKVRSVPHIIRLDASKKGKEAHFNIVKRVILEILPNKLNLFMLFCRFFKYVYPFVPVIDENSLMIDLNKLFGRFPYFDRTNYDDIAIETEHDINTIGILLIVIRLGYMSLVHIDEADNQYSEDEKSIIRDVKRTQSETFVSALKLCIDDRALGSRSTFKLVQLLSLYYFYRQIAPDDSHGLGGSDAQVLFGVILTHAKSIGLHRDPNFYVAHEVISKRESLKKTWRSLWFYLTVMDARAVMQSGIPPFLLSLDTSDVELPFHKDDEEYNLLVTRLHAVCESYRYIGSMIGNVVNKPKVIDILIETSKLEKLFSEMFGKDFFKETICKPAKVPENPTGFDANSREHADSYLKVYKYLMFINLRTNLNCMYYMIVMHYESDESSTVNSGIELFKIFCKSVFHLVFMMLYVLDNLVDVFGRNYDFLVASYNERCMIKTHNFLTSLFVRLLHHKKDCTMRTMADPLYKPRLDLTDSVFTIVLIEAELFVGNFRKLSVNYINSYKLYVMTYFVLKQCMENPSVLFEKINDTRFFHEGTNMFDFFTDTELKYLCKLIEDFRVAKDDQAKLKEARADVAKNAAKSGLPKKSTPQSFSLPFPDLYSQSQLYALSEVSFGAELSNGSVPGFSTESSPIFGGGPQRPGVNLSPPTATPPGNYPNLEGSIPNTEFAQPENGLFDGDAGGDDLLRLFSVYGDLDPNDLY